MIVRIVTFITLISCSIATLATVIFGIVFGIKTTHLLMVYLALFFVCDLTLIYSTFERRAPIFGRILWRGSTSRKYISLTFDDGPNEPYTSQLLDILNKFQVKATFFVIGKNAEIFPEALKREVEEGHEIGNHSYDHQVLPLKSATSIRDQIKKASDLIERVSSIRPRFFRAPHGWRNIWVDRVAKQEGLIPIAWTLGVWDTERPGAQVIIRRTLKGLKNGSIVLLHDGRNTEHGTDSSQLVQALPIIIDNAQRAGYRFVTLSEIMEENRKK